MQSGNSWRLSYWFSVNRTLLHMSGVVRPYYLFIFERFSTRILPALEIAWLFYTYGLYIDEV